MSAINLQTSNTFQILQDALLNGYTTVSAQGGARSGKTYNILIWIIAYVLSKAGTKVTVARATMPALKKTVFEDFKNILLSMGLFDEKRLNKTEMVYQFANGSSFEFVSTDSEQKLRGGKRDILFVNEANELRQIEFQQLKMRTTTFAILDYNPSFSEDHWISQDVNNDPRTYYFKTTYRDNPFLEDTIIEEIESLKLKNHSLWQVYGEGNQAQLEGLIFPRFEIVEQIPPLIKKRWLGVDFGYQQDPTAIVEVAINGNELYINELCYRTHMLLGEIIDAFKLIYQQKGRLKIIAESADPRLVQEIFNAGMRIVPVHKGSGSVVAGLLKMQEYDIKVTANSKNAIKELRYYTWDKDKEGNFTNDPIDDLNHAIDATRYVILSEVLGNNAKRVNTNAIATAIGR